MSAPQDKTPSQTPDWERIECDYRAGVLSLREIATQHGITEGAIRKRAKRDTWTRDLSEKIKSRADDLVRKDAVRSTGTQITPAAERQVIEANAEAIVSVRLSHRHDIRRSRAIVMSLFDELELTCGPENAALLAELGEIMREPDERGQDKRADLYAKLLSLNGRSVTMKNLGESLKNMVTLEREAFSLDAAPPSTTDALTTLLHGISTGSSAGFKPVTQDPAYDE